MIYLDNAATTAVLPEVLDSMMPYLTDNYGNAGSLHSLGRVAARAIGEARQQVADFLNCKPENIIFTSGGSEANNLAIKGVAPYLKKIGKTGIVTSNVEHDSVYNALREIKGEFHTHFLPVNSNCCIHLSNLCNVLRENSNTKHPIGLVSIMHTNNITGVLNNVYGLAGVAHNKGALFHTDCVQAAGYDTLDVNEIDCDFMSLSGHKIYAPKGTGALYVKDRDKLSPLISGGSAQEFGLRGGTENVAGIVGFGKACEIANKNGRQTRDTIGKCCSTFVANLVYVFEKYGIRELLEFNSIANKIVNFRVSGIDAQTLLLLLDTKGVCVSAGSACQSRESKPNKTLLAIGLSDEEARQSIRVSFSGYNTADEVRMAAHIIAGCVNSIVGMKD